MVLDVLSEYSDGLTSCFFLCSPVGHLLGYREGRDDMRAMERTTY